MRTTLTIDDDVLELAARQANLRGVSVGKAVSDLLRRALSGSALSRRERGVFVFQLPADSPVVTTEAVRRIETHWPGLKRTFRSRPLLDVP